MHHDVRPKFNGAAQNRRGERVVHEQRHAVPMGDAGELFDIQHFNARVGDGLAEQRLGVGAERGLNLVFGGFRRHESHFNAKPLERHGEQVQRAAVDGGGTDDMIPGGGKGQDGKRGRGLPGSGAQRPYPAFQHGDLLLDGVHGGIAETGIEEPGFLKVEQLADLLGGLVFERRALTDGQGLRFAVFRGIPGIQALRFDFHCSLRSRCFPPQPADGGASHSRRRFPWASVLSGRRGISAKGP